MDLSESVCRATFLNRILISSSKTKFKQNFRIFINLRSSLFKNSEFILIKYNFQHLFQIKKNQCIFQKDTWNRSNFFLFSLKTVSKVELKRQYDRAGICIVTEKDTWNNFNGFTSISVGEGRLITSCILKFHPFLCNPSFVGAMWTIKTFPLSHLFLSWQLATLQKCMVSCVTRYLDINPYRSLFFK